MEDTLRVLSLETWVKKEDTGLNPCFNGRYSQSQKKLQIGFLLKSLNPCFNGRYSQRGKAKERQFFKA